MEPGDRNMGQHDIYKDDYETAGSNGDLNTLVKLVTFNT
jgi:hypothetical protein